MSLHLLVHDREGREVVPDSLQLMAGCSGQLYNQRKHRQRAFWENRCHAAKQLGSKAKGREIMPVVGGCQLREGEATYRALFAGKKGHLSLENTLLWNRTLHHTIS